LKTDNLHVRKNNLNLFVVKAYNDEQYLNLFAVKAYNDEQYNRHGESEPNKGMPFTIP
jgi:hypothetical protein